MVSGGLRHERQSCAPCPALGGGEVVTATGTVAQALPPLLPASKGHPGLLALWVGR